MEPTGTRTRAGAAAVRRGRLLRPIATLVFAALAIVPDAFAEETSAMLARAATAARDLNYVGTIVYQHGAKVETSRLVHFNDRGNEMEKLVNLDGPAREVIRTGAEVRCYYPDYRIVRVEPRAFRNAFPSLSASEQKSLTDNYEFRKGESGRVAGLDAQAYTAEPKDGLRYGRTFWVDAATGLLLKARVSDERGEIVEQFTFTDLTIGVKIDPAMVKPAWSGAAVEWQVQKSPLGDISLHETGWTVARLPPGFAKVAEGYRPLRNRRDPVTHLVYSDGLVAVSVFIERISARTPRPLGQSRQGGINAFVRTLEDDYIVTVLGEVPPAAVRQMANSVTRRAATSAATPSSATP
jgi:sigma-E factor negative regulatory protein RseB